MGLKHFFLGCSLVFFLLLAGARGGDSYYGSSTDPKPSTPADQPKAEYEKPTTNYQNSKPLPVYEEKPKADHFEKIKPHFQKPEEKADQHEKPSVPPKPAYEKPKVDYEKIKPDYQTPEQKAEYEKPTQKPAYEKQPAQKPEFEKVDYQKSSQKLQYDKSAAKPVYEKPVQKVEYYTKPSAARPAGYNEKTKVEYEKITPADYEKEKSKVDYHKSSQNVRKPAYEMPGESDEYKKKPKVDYGTNHLDKMGLQGLVYCRRSAAHLEPLQGAVVRVTCLITKSESTGYESSAPVSFLCNPTNEKGYFFMTKKLSELESSGKKVVGACKAFLHSSPCDTCNVPTDANNGVTGAPLEARRLFPHNDMQLFSVGPFIYTPKPEAPAASTKGGAY